MERIELIERQVEDNRKRIDKLEESEGDQNLRIELNRVNGEYMKKAIDKTEAGVENIQKILTDHIQEPLKQLNGLKWAIITFIALAVVGYFIKFK